jgi:Family of unknown function (DUF6491)
MRTAFIALGLTAGLLLSGCSASDADSTPLPLTEKQSKLLTKQIGGKVAGTPVSCISTLQSDAVIRVSDDMLLYKVSGRLVYQNRLKSPCPGLASDRDIMVTEQFGSQQCRGDIIKLVDRIGGIPGPFCVLGDFVPYRKAPAAQ